MCGTSTENPTVHTNFLLYVIWNCFYTLSINQLYKNIERLTVWCFKIIYLSFYAHVYSSKNYQSLVYCDFAFTFPRLYSLHILHKETTSASYFPYDSVLFFSLHRFFCCFWNFFHTYLVPLFESRHWISWLT